MILAHRAMWELIRGPVPPGMHLDHDGPSGCHNPLCVNPDHLTLATPAQNGQRQRGLQSRNTSGYRNVHWSASMNRWRVRVTANGKRHYGGVFTDVHEAGAAAAALRARLHG